MKYFVALLLLLCLSFVGCSKDRGPDTGWGVSCMSLGLRPERYRVPATS